MPVAISVVIPTYNRADLLVRALRSVQSQTFTDWEIIVVDDGGTDHTPDVIPSTVQYIYQANAGPGAARNNGIQHATGEYISLLDSDDEYLPEHLATRLAILKRENVDLLAGGFSVTGAKRAVVDFYDPSKLVDLEECVVGGSFFGKREVFQNVPFGDLRYGEDTQFWIDAQRRYRTFFVREPKTYLLHETAGSLRLDKLTEFPQS
ncbi:glycosyl transferase [Bryobacterales bacterium F-183]|nr:glycosyl transferase [Bryobacterales bacterium F-183]